MVEQVIPHHIDLRDNAEDIEVRAKSEQEVPQLEDLVERRRASAQSHHGC